MAELPLHYRSTRARRTISGHKRVFLREEEDRESSLESPPCKKKKGTKKENENGNNDIYKEFVTQNLKSLLKDSHLSDVTFELNDELIYGNRCLFAAHSEVFKSMLYGNMMESSIENNVIITDMKSESFKYLKNTFYGIFDETPHLNALIVVDVLFAAEKYLIGPLIHKCIDFILCLRDVNDWYLVLKDFENSPFQSQSKMYLNQITNPICSLPNHKCHILHYKAKQFVNDAMFLTLNHDTLLIIVSSDHFAIEEHDLWISLLKWCKHSIENSDDRDSSVKSALTDFIPLIRFSQMDSVYFRENIVNTHLLSKDDIINIMFNRENPNEYKLSKFNSFPRIRGRDLNTFSLADVCLDLEEITNLKVGDLIDFRDYYGLFCSATVVDSKHSESRVKIHYNNWSVTYDEWVVYNTRMNDGDIACNIWQRFARHAIITERNIQRECFKKKFKDGNMHTNCSDECQVKLPNAFFKKNESYIENVNEWIGKWINAQIISHRISKKYSDHFKIAISINDEGFEYWVHPDNETEIRPI